MTESFSLTARRMCENDLGYVLTWRNHPEIRRFMLTQNEITVAEHYSWFNRASKDATRALLVIEERNQPIGCVIFSEVQLNSTAEWSFYASPIGSSGIGRRICSTALKFAFEELGIHKVSGRVLEFNGASIRIHQRLGFRQEGVLREHTLIDGRHFDLLCFGILVNEWQALNNRNTKKNEQQ